MLKARSSNEINYLCSPVTGGGVVVGRFGQLFLLAITQGKKSAHEWAQFAQNILKIQGQKILKDGAPLEDESQSLAELSRQADEFSKKQLPILKALQII